MSGNSFTNKQLRVTFILAAGNQFSNNSNTLTVSGLRMGAIIETFQYPAFPECDVQIFGMLQADMNTLTDFATHYLLVSRNSIVLEANAGNGWSTVFAGQITSASPVYQQAPDVPLRVTARVLYYESINSAGPTSYTGATDVVQIISGLAARMGASFINEGVSGVVLENPYYPGTLGDQLTSVVQAAGIGIFYDYGPVGNTGTSPPVQIIITPRGQPRLIPTTSLTPQTGLDDYPVFDSQGWIFARSLYNPALKFGASVSISGSDIPRANASWVILQSSHTLDAITPGGLWATDMHLCPASFFPYPVSP